jgi:beta-N-acetylhexosaminidase
MTRFGVTAVALAITGAVVAAVALASGDKESAAPVPARSSASALTTTQLVGQRITTGYVGTTPPRSVLRAVRAGRIGGVILFTNNMPSTAVAKRAITKLQSWAKAGGQPPIFVMIDQEGGIVQRLPQIPPNRSPQQIGRSEDPEVLARAEGQNTGRALKKLGFNVNLAPVVDIAKVRNSFLGNRSYGSSAAVVANAGCGFARGNEEGALRRRSSTSRASAARARTPTSAT